MIAKVELEPVVVFVAFETNWTGELPSRKVIFEWGKEVEIECDGHVGG